MSLIGSLGSLVFDVVANINTNKQIQGAITDIRNLESEYKSRISTIGQLASQILPSASFGGFIAGTVAAFDTVDRGMDTLTARVGEAEVQAAGLGDSFKNVFATGVTTDATELATALATFHTQLGLTGQPLEDFTYRQIRIAKVMGVDVYQSIDANRKIMSEYNLTAAEADQMLDGLTTAAQKTGVSFGTIQGDVASYGNTLNQMGYSSSESISLMSEMEKSGINVSNVMTGIKSSMADADQRQQKYQDTTQTISDLEDRQSKIKQQLVLDQIALNDASSDSEYIKAQQDIANLNDEYKDNAAKIDDAKKQQAELQDLMGKSGREVLDTYIAKIRGAGSEQEAMSIAVEAFGSKAAPEMVAAIRKGAFSIDDLTTSVSSSHDAVANADKDTQGLSETMDKLRNKATLAAAPIGSALADALEDLTPAIIGGIDFASGLATWFDQLPRPVRTATSVLGVVAGTALSASTMLFGLGGTVSGVFGIIGGSVSSLLGMLGLSGTTAAAAGVAGEGLIGGEASMLAEAAAAALEAAGPELATGAVAAGGTAAAALVGAVAAGVGIGLAGVWVMVNTGIGDALAGLGTQLKNSAPWLSDILKMLLAPIATIGVGIVDIATGNFGSILTDMMNTAEDTMVNAPKRLAKGILGAVGIDIDIGDAAQSNSGNFSSLPKYAEGAYVTSPTLAVFGESEPEYAVPESKARGFAQGVLGGAGDTYNISVNLAATVSNDYDVDQLYKRFMALMRQEFKQNGF